MHELCKAVKVLVLDGNIATKEKCKNEQRERKEKKIEKKTRHLEMYYLRSGSLFSPYNSF
jgi:hypothetical protein